jgi:hypothetical protein
MRIQYEHIGSSVIGLTGLSFLLAVRWLVSTLTDQPKSPDARWTAEENDIRRLSDKIKM